MNPEQTDKHNPDPLYPAVYPKRKEIASSWERVKEIGQNLQTVRERIENACRISGRDPEEVQLMAVSKKKPVSDLSAAIQAGQLLFGENYVQELTSKYEELKGSCSFHMIGHLQRNKVKYLMGKVDLIHSVDSLHLAHQIEREAAKADLRMDILLEVNMAEEESKWGFPAADVLAAVREISGLSHVRIKGLMTSAPYTDDAESNRLYFRSMKELFDRLKKENLSQVFPEILSMGMSGDYTVAVEEGSTLCRVGTAIFGAREA